MVCDQTTMGLSFVATADIFISASGLEEISRYVIGISLAIRNTADVTGGKRIAV
jgi:hypothetical protein